VSTHDIALAALEEALHDQIKSRFAFIFLSGKASPEALQHFQNGLHELRETYFQALAITMKEFP
jgi:hypothetical protein